MWKGLNLKTNRCKIKKFLRVRPISHSHLKDFDAVNASTYILVQSGLSNKIKKLLSACLREVLNPYWITANMLKIILREETTNFVDFSPIVKESHMMAIVYNLYL